LPAPSRSAIPERRGLTPADYTTEAVVARGEPKTADIGGDGEGIVVKLTSEDIEALLDVSVRNTRYFEVSPAQLKKARQDCYDIAKRALDAINASPASKAGTEHARATEQQIDDVLEALSVAVRQLGPEIVLDAVNRLLASPEYQGKLTEIADSYSSLERSRLSPLAAVRIGIGILFAAGIILPFVGDPSSQIAFQNAVQGGTLTAALWPLIRR
jgi:hypothetical protein